MKALLKEMVIVLTARKQCCCYNAYTFFIQNKFIALLPGGNTGRDRKMIGKAYLLSGLH